VANECFLLRDALHSARYAMTSCPLVCPSVCDVGVPCSYTLCSDSHFLHCENPPFLRYIHCNFCLNLHITHGDMKENVSGCFFLNTV